MNEQRKQVWMDRLGALSGFVIIAGLGLIGYFGGKSLEWALADYLPNDWEAKFERAALIFIIIYLIARVQYLAERLHRLAHRFERFKKEGF